MLANNELIFLFPAKMHDIDGALCTSSRKRNIKSGKRAQNFSIFSGKLPNIRKISCSICIMAMIWPKCTKI